MLPTPNGSSSSSSSGGGGDGGMNAEQQVQAPAQAEQKVDAASNTTTMAVASGPDSIVAELQRLSSTLRERHGLACAILGKDSRVVVFEEAPPPGSPAAAEEGKDEKDDETERSLGTTSLGTTSLGTLSTAPAIHPAAGTQQGSPRALGMDHFVSHEHADVILKVCGEGATKHLYASSGKHE